MKPGDLSCTLVKQIITDWARNREREPFPYRQVGDHLTQCLSCLSWSTEIAYQPGDRYVRALRLRLGEVLYLLGRSLLAAWSAQETVKIRFHVAPEGVAAARGKTLKFLRRYEGFSPATREEANRVREMVADSAATRDPKSKIQLEPYELVRYFFQTALDSARGKEERLDLLVYLGITENYQAWSEQRAGHDERALDHFQQARAHFGRVTAKDPHPYRQGVSPRAESDRTALISARINLAMTEVLQGRYSEVSLHNAVNLLYEAKRLVAELGLKESDYPNIPDNLLISYLRLYLDHGIAQAYEQARQLAREICDTPELGPLFLREFIRESADPELTQLLGGDTMPNRVPSVRAEKVKELADWFRQQAGGS